MKKITKNKHLKFKYPFYVRWYDLIYYNVYKMLGVTKFREDKHLSNCIGYLCDVGVYSLYRSFDSEFKDYKGVIFCNGYVLLFKEIDNNLYYGLITNPTNQDVYIWKNKVPNEKTLLMLLFMIDSINFLTDGKGNNHYKINKEPKNPI